MRPGWSGVTDYFSGKCSQSDLQASPQQQVHFNEYKPWWWWWWRRRWQSWLCWQNFDNNHHDDDDNWQVQVCTRWRLWRMSWIRWPSQPRSRRSWWLTTSGRRSPSSPSSLSSSSSWSSITLEYKSSSSVIFNKECLINRVTHDLWRKCSSALFRLVIRVLMCFVCCQILCFQPTLPFSFMFRPADSHLSLFLIRTAESLQKENLNCKIFSAQKCEKSG